MYKIGTQKIFSKPINEWGAVRKKKKKTIFGGSTPSTLSRSGFYENIMIIHVVWELRALSDELM